MNSNRLWVVVNIDTNDVFYASFDYNRSKCAYDKLVQPLKDHDGVRYPNAGALWRIHFVRYDVNRAYSDCFGVPSLSPFQKSLNEDFRAFMDFCLMKRGSNTNTNTNEVKKC